jgi:hypothetical protein
VVLIVNVNSSTAECRKKWEKWMMVETLTEALVQGIAKEEVLTVATSTTTPAIQARTLTVQLHATQNNVYNTESCIQIQMVPYCCISIQTITNFYDIVTLKIK